MTSKGKSFVWINGGNMTKVNLMKRVTTIFSLIFFLAGQAIFAEKSVDDYIEDLESDENQLVIIACQKLGAKKSTESIDALIQVLREHKSIRVRIAAASAIGNIEEKGHSTDALRDSVTSDASNDVVYASLLAIGNIKDISNPSAEEALEYCEENKTDDPFIKDIVVRVREFLDNK